MSGRERVGVIHVHSDYSRDGRDSLERLREFALEWNLAFIGLTDHAEDLDAERFDAFVHHCRAASDARVRLIPGLEYRFAGFTGLHLLALDQARWIAPRTPDDFIDQTRDAARFTILAHPRLADYRVPPAVADGIAAIEVWNARYDTRYLPDPRAIRLLRAIRRRRPDVMGTVGLDQHESRNYRHTRVIVHDSGEDPIAALKAGRFRNAGLTLAFGCTLAWDPLRDGALSMARWVLDCADRVHERVQVRRARHAATRESADLFRDED